jgi:hypothetical protein
MLLSSVGRGAATGRALVQVPPNCSIPQDPIHKNLTTKKQKKTTSFNFWIRNTRQNKWSVRHAIRKKNVQQTYAEMGAFKLKYVVKLNYKQLNSIQKEQCSITYGKLSNDSIFALT